MIYSFLAGVFPVSVMAVAAQTVLAPLWALVCFYDQRDALRQQVQTLLGDAQEQNNTTLAVAAPRHSSRLADLALQIHVDHTLGYFIFLVAMAFCVAALVEEWLKLWIVQGTCCCSTMRRGRGCCCCSRPSASKPMFATIRQENQHRRQQQLQGGSRGGLCHPSRLLFPHKRNSSHGFVVFMAVVAGALGFSLLENVVYTFSVDGTSDRVLTALVRGAVSTSLHCICGGITGVRVAAALQARRASAGSARESATIELGRWRTKARLLWPAVLVHGVFDLQIFLFATLTTQAMLDAHPQRYGVVLPGIVAVSILVLAFVFMRRSLHAMEKTMNEGRYIQVAVDLESGRRVSINKGPGRATFASDDEDEFDVFDDDLDDDEEGLIMRAGEDTTPGSKVRTVFNV